MAQRQETHKNMEYYYNKDSKTMHMHSTTNKGFPFVLSVHHEDDEHTVKAVSLTYPPYTVEIDGKPIEVGSVNMALRVKCWGDIFYRLTRGVEIPRNWLAHNEA